MKGDMSFEMKVTTGVCILSGMIHKEDIRDSYP
jgi:hypothetical protein